MPALLRFSLVETVRLTMATILMVAVSEATEKWMEQLRARLVPLHRLVLFASGVAGTSLLFVPIGERPPAIVFLAGPPSIPGGSRDDGRRWRTGTP